MKAIEPTTSKSTAINFLSVGRRYLWGAMQVEEKGKSGSGADYVHSNLTATRK
jgi:hypothetical protein